MEYQQNESKPDYNIQESRNLPNTHWKCSCQTRTFTWWGRCDRNRKWERNVCGYFDWTLKGYLLLEISTAGSDVHSVTGFWVIWTHFTSNMYIYSNTVSKGLKPRRYVLCLYLPVLVWFYCRIKRYSCKTYETKWQNKTKFRFTYMNKYLYFFKYFILICTVEIHHLL